MKFLKKIFMLLFYFVLSSVVFADFTTIELPSDFSISYKKDFLDKEIRNMYYDLKLNDKVSFTCFNNAVSGLEKISYATNELLVLVDYTKPSTEERLFVVDLSKKRVVFSSLVSHGKGNGGLYATTFTDRNNSYASSSGFYLTGNIYNGKHGRSLVLYGLEEGKNDNAERRTIVMHSADYVSEEFIQKNGSLGRSKGCLALPVELNAKIIDLIHDGVVIYVHTNFDENNEYDFSKLSSNRI